MSDRKKKTICLAGNPNVGKSTVFNALTGSNQHTGNWAGKTVSNAQGKCVYGETEYTIVDLPGTYSLMAHSAEEEVARDYICFGEADAVVVVCDATCLERNLNLVLQTMEITSNVVVCVNLMDEAKKKKITIDLDQLETSLGVPVIATTARNKKGLDTLLHMVDDVVYGRKGKALRPVRMRYVKQLEQAVELLQPSVEKKLGGKWNSRWISLKLLDGDETILKTFRQFLGEDITEDQQIKEKWEQAQHQLQDCGISLDLVKDKMVSCFVIAAEGICADCVTFSSRCHARDRKIDRILTSKLTGIPIMLLLLMLIFWLTISGANYPSQLLSDGFFWVQDRLTDFFHWMQAPEWLHGILVLGVYRVLAWVVSVMLPPMAIFFPLFTLLEDFGYLPRVAFNLDKYFKKANACGKQALTMCQGFGCNAVGVVGCRIIDSPRERLIAMVTNNFVPCNGRLPQP